MSAPKHTPGPWEANFGEAYFITGPDLGRVAMMMNLKGAHGLGGRRSGDESAANCRLIAAAPDLLAALQIFAERSSSEEFITITVRTAHVNRARDAIAKAIGDAT